MDTAFSAVLIFIVAYTKTLFNNRDMSTNDLQSDDDSFHVAYEELCIIRLMD